MIFVTAEIGTSWQGNYGYLETILQTCKNANVDAVKFQTLTENLIKRHPELSYYKDASLTNDNYMQISDMCDHYDLEYYTSIYEATEFDMPQERVKIRTMDSDNTKLIKFALDNYDQVIVSSIKPLKNKHKRVKNLYCIPRYPVYFGEINFDCLYEFDGYSNHCRDALAVLESVNNGIDFLEIHITPSRDFFSLDNSVSFSLNEFLALMWYVRKNSK